MNTITRKKLTRNYLALVEAYVKGIHWVMNAEAAKQIHNVESIADCGMYRLNHAQIRALDLDITRLMNTLARTDKDDVGLEAWRLAIVSVTGLNHVTNELVRFHPGEPMDASLLVFEAYIDPRYAFMLFRMIETRMAVIANALCIMPKMRWFSLGRYRVKEIRFARILAATSTMRLSLQKELYAWHESVKASLSSSILPLKLAS